MKIRYGYRKVNLILPYIQKIISIMNIFFYHIIKFRAEFNLQMQQNSD